MSTLKAEAVTVQFGGLLALSNAHVTVETGTITGLIGPNGAGKTTFFNVITGIQPPTAGTVTIDDGRTSTDLTNLSVHKRARAGISRTFQKLEAFNSLSALDNVRVAAEMRRRWDKSGAATPEEEAMSLLSECGIADVAEVTVATLPTGTARLVELARALACRPRFLLLDEPSSGLNEDETVAMGSLLTRLVREGDLGVLLVEHDMSFVMGVCDFIHVLDFGQIIAVGTPREIQQDAAVQAAYLGTAAETVVS